MYPSHGEALFPAGGSLYPAGYGEGEGMHKRVANAHKKKGRPTKKGGNFGNTLLNGIREYGPAVGEAALTLAPLLL